MYASHVDAAHRTLTAKHCIRPRPIASSEYNPTSPRAGDGLGATDPVGSRAYSHMSWYHWTSPDLLSWSHQPVALGPGAPEDCGGIWSGSMTLVRNASTGEATPMITYSVPCQQNINAAVPADPADPNLTRWTKIGTLAIIPDVVKHSDRVVMGTRCLRGGARMGPGG